MATPEGQTLNSTSTARKHPRSIRGTVVSAKMNKTRVISVNRMINHALYHKKVARTSRFFVHDEKNESQVGDLVLAYACRPLSKNKNFRLHKVIKRGELE